MTNRIRSSLPDLAMVAPDEARVVLEDLLTCNTLTQIVELLGLSFWDVNVIMHRCYATERNSEP